VAYLEMARDLFGPVREIGVQERSALSQAKQTEIREKSRCSGAGHHYLSPFMMVMANSSTV
jgi:hypothetical protein